MRFGTAAMSAERLRVEFDRPVQVGHGEFVLGGPPRTATTCQRGGIVRIDRERGVVRSEGLIDLVGGQQGIAAVDLGLRRVRARNNR
jgi:hypothetical protein